MKAVGISVTVLVIIIVLYFAYVKFIKKPVAPVILAVKPKASYPYCKDGQKPFETVGGVLVRQCLVKDVHLANQGTGQVATSSGYATQSSSERVIPMAKGFKKVV